MPKVRTIKKPKSKLSDIELEKIAKAKAKKKVPGKVAGAKVGAKKRGKGKYS